MNPYEGHDKDSLIRIKKELDKTYEFYKSQNLKLDMSRGKPCTQQLDLSNALYEDITDFYSENGTDCRNYGGIDGILEIKKLFADIFEVSHEEVIVGSNSSLNMMYDTIARAFNHGVYGGLPWSKDEKIKFLCPSPGYDRHFAITELFNIEMIVIPINEDGPDINAIEELVATDSQIKGMWCIPMYSNPTGVVYSDEVVRRLASMKTKASDFRIFWDNAYAVHHLIDNPPKLLNILTECKNSGNSDRVLMFTSTSKITFPGAGVSAMASSINNINHIKKQMIIQTIGPDKIKQLQHVRFLKDMSGINALMKKHAAIIKPKFDIVLDLFDKNLKSLKIANWSKPFGGYFISLDVIEGLAKKIVRKAKEAGVILTDAGATFPLGKDPKDSNIRIAPTYPPTEELKKAIEILCICIQIETIEKITQ